MTPHLHVPPSVRPPCGAPDRVALLARPRRPAACAREVVCLSHSRVCRLPFYVPHARERTRLSSFFVSFVSPGAALPRPVRAARLAARHGAESRGAHAPRRPRPVLRGRSLRSSPRLGHREEGCDERRGAGASGRRGAHSFTNPRLRVFQVVPDGGSPGRTAALNRLLRGPCAVLHGGRAVSSPASGHPPGTWHPAPGTRYPAPGTRHPACPAAPPPGAGPKISPPRCFLL